MGERCVENGAAVPCMCPFLPILILPGAGHKLFPPTLTPLLGHQARLLGKHRPVSSKCIC